MPGGVSQNPTGPSNPNVLFGSPTSFSGAATTQASDYDKIMANYNKMFNAPGVAPISYTGSSDVTSALGNLKDLSTTGGYSAADLSNIRARGISPIRSIYANAQQDLQRQRALQGGYSPGMGAATAKMARESSDLIAGKTTDVNAQLAQSVEQNRLSAASPYASLAESEAGRGLDVSKFNTELAQQGFSNKMGAIQGMQSLYGTTPALTTTFGNQVAQAAQLGQNQQQINNQRRQQQFNPALLSMIGGRG